MSNTASYILSAYSFISNLPLHQILDVGNQEKNGSPIPSFSEDILIDLCKNARKIFKTEENIIKIDGDVIIVGDIHGSLHDLLRILKYADKKQTKVLFLGDYVDRGDFSLECITILFAMKILNPDSFFMIRGNHEFDALCSKYGFKREILNHHNPKMNLKEKNYITIFEDDENFNENGNNDHHTNLYDTDCYQYTEKLYRSFIKAFSYLPLASIVNQTTFCVHGGLSPLLDNLNIINLINRPIYEFDKNILLTDIVWSDPSHSSLTSFRQNNRGCGYYFNEKAVSRFLKANSLTRIIRAHQCVKNGIAEHFNKKCITVFSASSYSFDMGNHSGILRINKNDDTTTNLMFPPLHRLKKEDSLYYKFVPQKQNYSSMKQRNILFKGKTSKIVKSESKIQDDKNVKQKRDFNSLKIHCHVNPALIINNRKSAFPFIHVPSNDHIKKTINHSISLPSDLLIKKDDSILNEISKNTSEVI